MNPEPYSVWKELDSRFDRRVMVLAVGPQTYTFFKALDAHGKGTVSAVREVPEGKVLIRALVGQQPGRLTLAKLERFDGRSQGYRRIEFTCQSNRDGECSSIGCPQLLEGEPHHTGRHCPIDKRDEEY